MTRKELARGLSAILTRSLETLDAGKPPLVHQAAHDLISATEHLALGLCAELMPEQPAKACSWVEAGAWFQHAERFLRTEERGATAAILRVALSEARVALAVLREERSGVGAPALVVLPGGAR